MFDCVLVWMCMRSPCVIFWTKAIIGTYMYAVYTIYPGITENVFSDFIQYIELSMTLLMARFH